MPAPTRDSIARLPAYALAEQDVPGVERVIQLGQNELGIAPSRLAIEAAAGAWGALNRYPDPDHRRLRLAIAETHGLRPERIACGAGSMELMGLLATAYCEPGVDVVVSRLGYKYFELQCAIAGAALRVAPEPLRGVDVGAVLGAVTERTRLVYIVNPNNPTGTCLEDGGLARLRARLPERVMLVVDAAYAEFAADRGYESGLELVESGRNVVVLRTFSKAYGLAGLRVGWLYAPDDVIDVIARVRPPNTITPAGLAAAEAAVRDRPHLDGVVREVTRLREEFRLHVRKLGLEAGPSHSNFVLVRFPDDGPVDAGQAFERLKNAGIIVRPTGSYGLSDCLRVTIGSAEEMAAVSGELARIVDERLTATARMQPCARVPT